MSDDIYGKELKNKYEIKARIKGTSGVGHLYKGTSTERKYL